MSNNMYHEDKPRVEKKVQKNVTKKSSKKKVSKKYVKQCPEESAKNFKLNTVKKGLDKKMWIVKKNKNGNKVWERKTSTKKGGSNFHNNLTKMDHVKLREGSRYNESRTKKSRGPENNNYNNNYQNEENYNNINLLLRFKTLGGDQIDLDFELPEVERFVINNDNDHDPYTVFIYFVQNKNERNLLLNQRNNNDFRSYLPSRLTQKILKKALENEEFKHIISSGSNQETTIQDMLLSPLNFHYE